MRRLLPLDMSAAVSTRAFRTAAKRLLVSNHRKNNSHKWQEKLGPDVQNNGALTLTVNSDTMRLLPFAMSAALSSRAFQTAAVTVGGHNCRDDGSVMLVPLRDMPAPPGESISPTVCHHLVTDTNKQAESWRQA